MERKLTVLGDGRCVVNEYVRGGECAARERRVQRAKCNRVSRRSAPAVWSLRSETGEETYSCRCPEIDSPLGYATRFWPGGADLVEGEKILQTSIYVARVDRPKSPYPIDSRRSMTRTTLSRSKKKKKMFLFFVSSLIFFPFFPSYIRVYIFFFVSCFTLYLCVGVCPRHRSID